MSDELDYIYNYAFIYNGSLDTLASMAEPEKWSFEADKPNSILNKYLINTFTQCRKQNKVLVSENEQYSCFNTGLLTPNGNDIIALFEKNVNEDRQPWFLKGFKDKCAREILDIFPVMPELAKYTNNYEELFFNPDVEIVMNTDHILDDNWERIFELVKLDKAIVKTLLNGVINEATVRIRRNIRLVVPQFYNDEIMYLVPIRFPTNEGNSVVTALAVEKSDKGLYRANTIFTKEMAYEKARLLMKPESNWLIE